VRTTVELPDDLFRRAKAQAALQGRPLKELVAQGLRLLLQSGQGGLTAQLPRRTQFPIITPRDPGRRLTPEMVAAADDQALGDEAAHHGRLTGH
jgi:hypothetical protein